jgi:hypothetical protein
VLLVSDVRNIHGGSGPMKIIVSAQSAVRVVAQKSTTYGSMEGGPRKFQDVVFVAGQNSQGSKTQSHSRTDTIKLRGLMKFI